MKSSASFLKGHPQLIFWSSLSAIVLFGCIQAFARFHASLNIDEPFSANLVQLPFAEMWQAFRHDNAHPVYFLLLKVWVAVFGESEISLRFPSLLFFAAMIITICLTARYLAGARSGLVAAFLASISSNSGLTFAATARPYALLSLLVTVALLIAVRLMRLGWKEKDSKLDRRRDLTLCGWFIIVSALGLLTHPIFAFFLTACMASSIIVGKRPFVFLVISCILSVGIYFILWGNFFFSAISLPATKWIGKPDVVVLLSVIVYLWGALKSVAFLLFVTIKAVRYRPLVLCYFTTLPGKVMAGIIILTVIIPFVISQWRPLFITSRAPSIFLPAACILVGSILIQFKPHRPVIVLMGAVALASLLISDWRTLELGPFFTREGVAQVVSQARCGDRLVSVGLSFGETQYYLRRLNAPACLRHESFPAEIQAHPGWMDAEGMLSRRTDLESEAAELTTQLISQPQYKVWMFYIAEPPPPMRYHTQVAHILKSELDKRLPVVEQIKTRGSFFDSILVFSGGKKTSELGDARHNN